MLNQYFIYPISIFLTICWVYYTARQFDDAKLGWGNTKGKWHIWGVLARSLPFLMVFIIPSVYDIFLAGNICIILFEIGINVVCLQQKPFFIGTTAMSDIKFGKYKWMGMAILLIIALILKLK